MMLGKSLTSVLSLLLYVLQTKVSFGDGPIGPAEEQGDIIGVRQSFFHTLSQKINSPNSVCRDGNFAAGRCLSLKDCPNLLRIAKVPKSGQYKFLQFSYCGTFQSFQHFCCKAAGEISEKLPSSTTSKTTTSKTTTSKTTNSKTTTSCETSPDINFIRCGETKLLGTRILGGKVVEKNSLPWMAMILKESKPACGGSLITNRHVLSAAHCFPPGSRTNITVRLAEHDSSTASDGKHFDMAIDKIVVHEDYDHIKCINDIAMIKLKRPVCFSKRVLPVCIPGLSWKSRNLEPYKPYVAGWGLTETQDFASNVLLQAKLSIFNTDECRLTYITFSTETAKSIDNRTICAGHIRGLKDSCGGDSGGPLLLTDSRSRGKNGAPQQFLIGVVSRGPKKCGSAGLPGLYVRVSSYFDWIKKHAV